LDFFTKAKEEIETATGIGGLFSLAALGLAILFFLLEIGSFVSVEWVREIKIENDNDLYRTEHMNLDMYFYNLPCHLITLNRVENEGGFDGEIKAHLERYDNNHRFIANYISGTPNENTPGFHQEIIDAIHASENCRVLGPLEVTEIPGHIEFGFKHKTRQYHELPVDFREQLNLAFKFNHLSFGLKNETLKVQKMYGDKINFAPYDGMIVSDLVHNEKINYYAKVVPNTFYSKRDSLDYARAYQFSFNSKKKTIEGNEMPNMQIAYEFNPVTIEYVRTANAFTGFLVHILAIIGGIFSTIGLVNSFILSRSKTLRTRTNY
jgi:hypothetical protein